MDVTHKTFLLTGATGGIGSAMAKRLLAAGATLRLVGRDRDKLTAFANTPNCQLIIADLTQTDNLSQLAEQAGSIDGLINCAGIPSFNAFADINSDTMAQLITVNLLAPMILTTQLLPVLQQQPEALIVNVGSTFGHIGHPGYAAYCATKFGLRGFSEALSRELADTSIRVLQVAPRAVATPFNSAHVEAMNKALGNHSDTPDVVADAIMHAIRQRQTRLQIGWPEKFFVLLNQLLPTVVDRALTKKLPLIKTYLKKESQS